MIQRSTNSGWVMWLAIAVFAVVMAVSAITKSIDEHNALVTQQAEFESRMADHAIPAYEAMWIDFNEDFDKAVKRIEAIERKLGDK
jgi:hypothetical protein